jgi:hypothetical protein
MAVGLIAMMMEAAKISETLVNFYQTTWRYNPENSHLRTHCRENLKSYRARLVWIEFGEVGKGWVRLRKVSSGWFRLSSLPRWGTEGYCSVSQRVWRVEGEGGPW